MDCHPGPGTGNGPGPDAVIYPMTQPTPEAGAAAEAVWARRKQWALELITLARPADGAGDDEPTLCETPDVQQKAAEIEAAARRDTRVHRHARHQPQNAKQSTGEVGGPSCKIDRSAPPPSAGYRLLRGRPDSGARSMHFGGDAVEAALAVVLGLGSFRGAADVPFVPRAPLLRAASSGPLGQPGRR
jgi:hypothetical protein